MWANEQVIELSKLRLKYCKKYVVFCRSYEIFYGHVNGISWNKIDDVVFACLASIRFKLGFNVG